MKVLMIVRSDVAHDARVVREAVTLTDAGHAVTVVGSNVADGWEPPPGVEVQSLGARSVFGTSGRRRQPLPLHLRLARWALLPRHNASVNESFRRSVRAWADDRGPFDVVHAHDMPMLAIGAELAQRWRAALVYDSHEWWSGRRREQRPTPIMDRREQALERRLARRADAVLTVSPGIAERFEAWSVSDVRVVRNTFPITADAPPPVENVSSLLYAGRVDGSRDLDTVLRAVGDGLDVGVTLLGPGDPTYLASHPLPVGVRWRAPVATDTVDDELRAAGVALVTLDDSCDNHRLALPNKLYQAVRAGVPVVASDLPEIARVVNEYGVGELYAPGDAVALRTAIGRVRADPTRYSAGLSRARQHLAWQVDAAELVAVYATMGAMRSREPSA